MTDYQRAYRRAPLWPRIASVVAAALLALGGASAAAASTTPAPEPSATPTPSTPTGSVDDVSATLVGYGPFVVTDGQSLAATLNLENDSSFPVPEVSATLSITRQPLASREALDAFYSDPSSVTMRKVTTTAVGAPEVDEDDEPLGTGTLSGRSSAQAQITASAEDLALPAGAAGVYGVTASFAVGSSTVFVDSMALTWLDKDIAPLPVTAIATITGQPSRASSLLAGADIDGVTLVVDPSSLTPAAALDRMEGHETYLLPASNPDLPSLAHAGDSALIGFALDESRARTWTAVADQPWLAISAVADQSVIGWSASAGAVATLFAAERATSAPDIPEVDGWTPAVATVDLSDEQQAPLVVPDAQLSSLIASFRPSDPAGPSRIVAESALLALAGDGTQSVVVAPGPNWVVEGEAPSANLAALMSAPWVTPNTLAQTIADPRRGVSDLPKAQGVGQDVPVERVDALADRLHGLDLLAPTAEYPASILSPGGMTILGAVSSSLRGDSELQSSAYDMATEEVDAMLEAVAIVRNSDVNLIAASGEVPITVRNALSVDSTVTVVMRSTSPNLQVRDWPTITVPAGGEATAMIPVEAVSSANVALAVRLVNSDGADISEAQNFTMRVRADWGSAATAVFTGLLVLVMIGGIIRTVRRGRKDTRTGPGPAAEGAKIVDGEVHD
ncbi:DUF6049 family protein [Demequina aurantiaca]|uniref:DUF6049 family protein n=1 Tax=Demequina aurantiaca TaxID=676200 RepID=UPI003D344E00